MSLTLHHQLNNDYESCATSFVYSSPLHHRFNSFSSIWTSIPRRKRFKRSLKHSSKSKQLRTELETLLHIQYLWSLFNVTTLNSLFLSSSVYSTSSPFHFNIECASHVEFLPMFVKKHKLSLILTSYFNSGAC